MKTRRQGVEEKRSGEHARSFDRALDKALTVACGMGAVPALWMIGSLVFAAYKLWEKGVGV